MSALSRTNSFQRSFATGNEVRQVFRENRAELEWLAYFITGDRTIATICVTEACLSTESHNSVFSDWVLTWARHSTIRSAIDTQRERVKKISPHYSQLAFIRRAYAPLTADTLEFVVAESETLITKLDVVCRVALVLCGVQNKSIAETALMLGISLGGVQAAYSKAMNEIEATRYQPVTGVNTNVFPVHRA